MLLVEVNRERGGQPAKIVKDQITAETEPALEDAKASRVVRKVMKTKAFEVVKAMVSEMNRWVGSV